LWQAFQADFVGVLEGFRQFAQRIEYLHFGGLFALDGDEACGWVGVELGGFGAGGHG